MIEAEATVAGVATVAVLPLAAVALTAVLFTAAGTVVPAPPVVGCTPRSGSAGTTAGAAVVLGVSTACIAGVSAACRSCCSDLVCSASVVAVGCRWRPLAVFQEPTSIEWYESRFPMFTW